MDKDTKRYTVIPVNFNPYNPTPSEPENYTAWYNGGPGGGNLIFDTEDEAIGWVESQYTETSAIWYAIVPAYLVPNRVSGAVPYGAQPPADPTGVTATVSGTTMTLSWNPSTGATEYTLDGAGWTGTDELTGSPQEFTGIAPGTYSADIRASNAVGTSPGTESTFSFTIA
jgi:hypothetical protein